LPKVKIRAGDRAEREDPGKWALSFTSSLLCPPFPSLRAREQAPELNQCIHNAMDAPHREDETWALALRATVMSALDDVASLLMYIFRHVCNSLRTVQEELGNLLLLELLPSAAPKVGLTSGNMAPSSTVRSR
jgi:hypothetical protein